MNLPLRLSTQLVQRSENWQTEADQSAAVGGRPVGMRVRMQVLRVAVSIVLLVGVFFLVSVYYDTAQILHDLRRLSVPTLAIITVGLFANTLAAVLRFKVIATEIKHPIPFRRAMMAVGAGSLAGALFFQLPDN